MTTRAQLTRRDHMKICLMLLCACAPALQVDLMPPPPELRRDASVIVFGVYHAGHMDPEAWQWVEQRLNMSFNRTHCPTFFNEELLKKDADTFSAVAEIARNEGLGATVLQAHGGKLAESDLIAVIDVSGHIPRNRPGNLALRPRASGLNMNGAGMGGPGGGGKRKGGASTGPLIPKSSADTDSALEVNVSVYQRPAMTRMARVHVRYNGENEDDAWNAVNTKLREAFPEWHCTAP